MSNSVLFELNDGVLVATLNEPEKMNALTPGIRDGLFEAIERANVDDDVRALVITGAGRGFCAGADVSRRRGGEVEDRQTRMDQTGVSGRVVSAFASCEVPIIAGVNGAAAGAGFGLATCCDIRIMAKSARMGSIFIKRGLASDFGAVYWLPRIVGVARAYELIYNGDLLDAEQCLAVGLATRVVDDEVLLEETLGYARKIADGPPLAYTVVRRMMLRAQYMPVAEFAEYEWTHQRQLLTTNDVAEGFKAFSDRRPPKFLGN